MARGAHSLVDTPGWDCYDASGTPRAGPLLSGLGADAPGEPAGGAQPKPALFPTG
jgi:hypothetical protein